jgi:ABC-type multidrug transport system fused ATPase/permease subunit
MLALLTQTILSNITYGTPNATKEEAIQAAIRANAHDFICAMEDGYDTEVSHILTSTRKHFAWVLVPLICPIFI